MKIRTSTRGGRSVPNLCLVTLYLLFSILAFTTALPIEQQSDSISTTQLPKAREHRSLPGSLATAPKGAVGEPPLPVTGATGNKMEPTKKPVYFTLLAISVFVCIIIVMFERL
ncbi:hypothetical protein AJ78_06444 [Emergomyces pasteurianus Ep9510]|uniref:Uncharacterized protein n=1 Tax=Emergomyces pasteurianus Ep9510 TaxID=1447872 RepID=A0A1J9QAV0_9EURO|nr:hypothetical protein AJ78_06444 [Emergomyces pasteurianus Ep9510]